MTSEATSVGHSGGCVATRGAITIMGLCECASRPPLFVFWNMNVAHLRLAVGRTRTMDACVNRRINMQSEFRSRALRVFVKKSQMLTEVNSCCLFLRYCCRTAAPNTCIHSSCFLLSFCSSSFCNLPFFPSSLPPASPVPLIDDLAICL